MNSRRKLLLALSGASATAVWAKPVVQSVMLPAHAATSGCTGTIQLFAEGFVGPAITGNPPEVTIGTTYNFLITTDCPNTELFYATYNEDGMRVSDVQSLKTNGDGITALEATPEAPSGKEALVLANVASDLLDEITKGRIFVNPVTPEEAFLVAIFVFGKKV